MLEVRERIFGAFAASLRRASTEAALPDILAAAAAGCNEEKRESLSEQQQEELASQLSAAAEQAVAVGCEYVSAGQLAAAAAAGAAGTGEGKVSESGAAAPAAKKLLTAGRTDQRPRHKPGHSSRGGGHGSGGGTTAVAASLNGWCPVSLAASAAADDDPTAAAGAPVTYPGLPADPRLGAVRYQGALFGFSSAEAAVAFCTQPDATLQRAAAAAAAEPLLQHMLNVHAVAALHPLPAASGGGTVVGAADGVAPPAGRSSRGGGGWAAPLRWLLRLAAGPLRCEMGTQTPTHFVEGLIDLSYQWNEWALRRRVRGAVGVGGRGGWGFDRLDPILG